MQLWYYFMSQTVDHVELLHRVILQRLKPYSCITLLCPEIIIALLSRHPSLPQITKWLSFYIKADEMMNSATTNLVTFSPPLTMPSSVSAPLRLFSPFRLFCSHLALVLSGHLALFLFYGL